MEGEGGEARLPRFRDGIFKRNRSRETAARFLLVPPVSPKTHGRRTFWGFINKRTYARNEFHSLVPPCPIETVFPNSENPLFRTFELKIPPSPFLEKCFKNTRASIHFWNRELREMEKCRTSCTWLKYIRVEIVRIVTRGTREIITISHVRSYGYAWACAQVTLRPSTSRAISPTDW